MLILFFGPMICFRLSVILNDSTHCVIMRFNHPKQLVHIINAFIIESTGAATPATHPLNASDTCDPVAGSAHANGYDPGESGPCRCRRSSLVRKVYECSSSSWNCRNVKRFEPKTSAVRSGSYRAVRPNVCVWIILSALISHDGVFRLHHVVVHNQPRAVMVGQIGPNPSHEDACSQAGCGQELEMRPPLRSRTNRRLMVVCAAEATRFDFSSFGILFISFVQLYVT